MFLRETTSKRKYGTPVKYLQLVENKWDPEKKRPVTRVLCNFGRIGRLNEQELRTIAEKLLSYLEKGEAGEGFRLGETREFGLLHLVEGLWKRLKLDVFFRAELRKHKYEMPVERALIGMLCNRCQAPDSKAGTYQWLEEETFFLAEQSFELHHLYRALDFLETHHDEIEEALFFRLCDLFNREVDLVFFDTTSAYFEVRDPDEQSLVQYGHPHCHRADRPQVLLGLAVNQEGLPLASEVFAGNTADVATVGKMVERTRRLGVRQCIFVSDRGTISEANLTLLREAGYEFIVGVKLRVGAEIRGRVLKADGAFQEVAENLMVKEVMVEDRRYVLCYNPHEARKDRLLREKWLQRLEQELPALNAGSAEIHHVLTHPVLKNLCRQDSLGRWVVDEERVREEERCDGVYIIRSSKAGFTAAQIATAYKSLQRVEEAFHYLKSFVELRPCYHSAGLRIKGHVLLCVLAYLMERLAELRSGHPWPEIQRAFRKVHATEVKLKGQSMIERADMNSVVTEVLRKLKIAYPPKVLRTKP